MYRPDPPFFSSSKRLDYVNHARRLAEDDWTGMESGEEENKKDEEEMDIDPGKKLPKRYANQVSEWSRARTFLPQAVKLPNTRKKRAASPVDRTVWGTGRENGGDLEALRKLDLAVYQHLGSRGKWISMSLRPA